MNSVVTFNINNQTMGVDIVNVERIIKLPKVSLIPNSAEYIEGVIDVQDMLIPIINLKKKFKFSSKDMLHDSSVIIIFNENKKCGIVVDNVNDITDVTDANIMEAKNNDYVYGVVKIEDTVINLLNSTSLLLD